MTKPVGDRSKCGAKKTNSDDRCRQPAGAGTDHVGTGRCKFHGGSTSSGKKAAAKEALRKGLLWYGDPVDVAPEEALLQEVRRTAGHVLYLNGQLEALDEAIDDLDSMEGGERAQAESQFNLLRSLYRTEREHLTKVCQVALHAGIEERQVRLAESQGKLIADAIRGILRDLGVEDHPESSAVVRKHLTLLDGSKLRATA